MKSLNAEQSARLRSLLKSLGIILLVGIIYYLFVKIVGFGIPCVFNLITGLHCPGCGISRMFISLAAFDFKAAFGHNALLMILLPIASIFIIKHYTIYVLNGKQKATKIETAFLIICFILMIAFGILRNIPYFSFLAP